MVLIAKDVLNDRNARPRFCFDSEIKFTMASAIITFIFELLKKRKLSRVIKRKIVDSVEA